MKRWRGTLAVVGIFVALGLAVVLFNPDKNNDSKETENEHPQEVSLLDQAVETLRTLTISDGEETIKLVQTADGWQFILPEPRPAHSTIVYIAVEDLLRLSARQVLRSEVTDAAQYGLAPPALTLTLEMRTGKVQQIVIGWLTTDSMGYYLQRTGDSQLYLVNQYTLQPFFQWMDEPPYEITR